MTHPFEESFESEEIVPIDGIDLRGMPKRDLPHAHRDLTPEQQAFLNELLEAADTMPPENDLPTDSFDPLMDVSPMNGNDGDIRFEEGTVIHTSPPINPPALPNGTIFSH